jgi:phenylalanyl-tRNA synthetase beta chain
MQFSEQWLRAYVNPPIGSDELAARLTMAGLEVEGNEAVAPPFTGVVVAHVKHVSKHPNADKLTVCEVDDGSGENKQIVCGAPNVAAGIRVPCARVGAVLPGDFKIKEARMRGVESQGMLCSARELKLSEDHSGLMILDADAPVGQDVREYLNLDDRCLTIKLTPNRGDCLSLIGVAREVAAITGASMCLPQFTPLRATLDERLPVNVLAADLCGRFSGRVVRGLNAHAATPAWMRQRLERSGQRPISALVDISNYVMLELGRPSHVFDLDKVSGPLEVRWGRPGETVELLNGQTVEVDDWVGVIADRRGVEALAGVMGGEHTAVTLDTTNVYVEAAFWWPESIQGRGRRFNFSTDAAHRFERGVDFSTTVDHLEYITRLILDICGTPETKVGPVDDQVLRLPSRDPVAMRSDRCRKVIGVAIADDEIAAIFDRLGLPFMREADRFVVTPPSYRFDLEIEEDLIEEVARLYGFERIPAHPPLARAVMRAQPESIRPLHALRSTMARAGYQELVNYSFVEAAWEQDFAGNPSPIKLLNPIASHLAVMRSSLVGSLVAALQYNLNRKAARVRVFELGRVFLGDATVQAVRCGCRASISRNVSVRSPTGRLPKTNGVSRRAMSISSTSRGILKPCCAITQACASLRPRILRCTRGAVPGWTSPDNRSVGSASFILACSRSTSCRKPRSSSNSMRMRCFLNPSPAPRRCRVIPRFSAIWRSGSTRRSPSARSKTRLTRFSRMTRAWQACAISVCSTCIGHPSEIHPGWWERPLTLC